MSIIPSQISKYICDLKCVANINKITIIAIIEINMNLFSNIMTEIYKTKKRRQIKKLCLVVVFYKTSSIRQ